MPASRLRKSNQKEPKKLATNIAVFKVEVAGSSEALELLDQKSRICNWARNVLIAHANFLRRSYRRLQRRLVERQSRLRHVLQEIGGDWSAENIDRFLAAARSVGQMHRAIDYTTRTQFSTYGLRDLLVRLKSSPDYREMNRVYSAVLASVALDLTKSIRAWLDGVKGRRPYKPNRPKKHRWPTPWCSLNWPGRQGYKYELCLVEVQRKEKAKKSRRAKNRTSNQWKWKLSLALGPAELSSEPGRRPLSQRVDLTLDRPFPQWTKNQEPTSVRVKKEHGKYYAVFNFRREAAPKKPIGSVIAIDPHHRDVMIGVDSNGIMLRLTPVEFIDQIDRSIDAIKSKRDRKLKKAHRHETPRGKVYFTPSRRWARLHGRTQQTYGRRARSRKHFLEVIANWLYKNYDAIVIGNYAPKGDEIPEEIDRRPLMNQSILGDLRSTIARIAPRSGKVCLVLDEKDTSRTCHDCGHLLDEPVPATVQEWTCPGCQTMHRKHQNAAKNMLRAGLEKLAEEHGCKLPIPQAVNVAAQRRLVFDPTRRPYTVPDSY